MSRKLIEFHKEKLFDDICDKHGLITGDDEYEIFKKKTHQGIIHEIELSKIIKKNERQKFSLRFCLDGNLNMISYTKGFFDGDNLNQEFFKPYHRKIRHYQNELSLSP